MMSGLNTGKWLFMVISGEKVYKLHNYNGVYYKIILFEPEYTSPKLKAGKWFPQFIIHQIDEKEYLTILRTMEKDHYKSYLSRCNERVVRYLNRKYFPYGETGENGLNINELIKESKTDNIFLGLFREEC